MNWISRNKEWIFSGIGVAILGAIITLFSKSWTSPPPISPLPPSAVIVEESIVHVPANKYWYDTGVKVQKADWLVFVASGSWYSGISTTGPDGDGGRLFGMWRPACGECPVTDGNLGELIGKILDGPPFRIRRSATQAVNQNGNLMLAMNENTGPCKAGRAGSCYEDNKGELEVKVTVRRIK